MISSPTGQFCISRLDTVGQLKQVWQSGIIAKSNIWRLAQKCYWEDFKSANLSTLQKETHACRINSLMAKRYTFNLAILMPNQQNKLNTK